jgi:hypothetical protein
MQRNSCVIVLLLFAALSSSCTASRAVSQSNPPASPSPINQPGPSNPTRFKMFDDFISEDYVSIEGYRAIKREKTARVPEYPKPVDVTYAVITRQGRLVSKFDGFAADYHPMGSSVDFGIFPLLGNNSKQLIIEQTQWRASAHWIVNFSPRYHVIFDGSKWGVDRELEYADIDSDGIYEISQAMPAFMFFEDLTNATSHLIDIVFKYDGTKQEYLPANQILQTYSLAGLDDEIKALDKSDAHKFEADVLLIVLHYIYAGKRNEAWSFYNREYNLPDKERLRGKILATLRDEPVYRFLYG